MEWHSFLGGLPNMPALSWRADEVLLELDDRDHLLARIEVRGGTFALRDAPAFVQVMGPRQPVRSWFAWVAEDLESLSGYFPVDGLPPAGTVEFGHGNRVEGRVPEPFEAPRVERLDRERLEGAVVVTEAFLKRKRAGKLPPEIRMPEARRGRPKG